MIPPLSRWLSFYLSSACLLAALAVVVVVAGTWLTRMWGARRSLALLRGAVVVSLALSFAWMFASTQRRLPFAPALVTVVGSQGLPSVESNLPGVERVVREPVVALPIATTFAVAGLGLALLLLAMARPLRAWGRLRRVIHALPVERQLRSLRIVLSRHHGTFAVGFWRSRTVCMAESVWADRQRRRWVMAHELAHLRHHDSLWTLGGFVVRAFYAPFPWVGWLMQSHAALCEFAADEAAIKRHRLAPARYAAYLLEQAELSSEPSPVFAAAFGRDPTSLKRRFTMLLQPALVQRPWMAAAVGLVACVGLTGVGHATANLIGTPTLAPAEVERLVAQTSSDLPIVVTPEVVARLNQTLGSAEARAHWRKAFARLPLLQPQLLAAARDAQMPDDVVALAMFESGLDAVAESPGQHARGVWQFIASTARRYGLRVDDEVDERIDLEKGTVAAMRLLGDLHREFGDWPLAFKAYNEGSKRVHALIDEHHTRDVWQLERVSSPEHYVPGVMAALILYKHPELLNAE